MPWRCGASWPPGARLHRDRRRVRRARGRLERHRARGGGDGGRAGSRRRSRQHPRARGRSAARRAGAREPACQLLLGRSVGRRRAGRRGPPRGGGARRRHALPLRRRARRGRGGAEHRARARPAGAHRRRRHRHRCRRAQRRSPACTPAETWRAPVGGADRPLRLEHWGAAASSARAVASAIAGMPLPGATPPFFWSDQFGWRLQAVGLPSGRSRSSWTRTTTGRHTSHATATSAGGWSAPWRSIDRTSSRRCAPS